MGDMADWYRYDPYDEDMRDAYQESEYIMLEGEFVKQTAKAVCYDLHLYGRHWFPKKLCKGRKESSVTVWAPFLREKFAK